MSFLYSQEGSKEKGDSTVESGQVDRHCKLPRISDVDMFSSNSAEQQRASADTADNDVHSSGEVEVVPPSPLQRSKTSSLLNTSVLMGTRTTLHCAASHQKQSLESYPVVETPDDVEPDDSSVSSSVESIHYEQSSGRDAVVTEADSCCVIHTDRRSSNKHDQLIVDEEQNMSARPRSSSGFQTGAYLLNSRGIFTVSEPQLDGVACINASDIEVIDLVTQSSAADYSFHSSVTEDMDSSQVAFIFRCDVHCFYAGCVYPSSPTDNI